jgi:hypothetical protein
MKSIPTEGMILESVPIIGIKKIVINSDLEREFQLEFYSFNQQLLSELIVRDMPEIFQYFFEIINSRAALLSSLTCLLEEDDFKIGMITMNPLPNEIIELFYKVAFKSGLIETIGSLNGVELQDQKPLETAKWMLN